MLFSIALLLANICPQNSTGYIDTNYTTNSFHKYNTNEEEDNADKEEIILISHKEKSSNSKKSKNENTDKEEKIDEELKNERLQMLAFSIAEEAELLQSVSMPIE